MAEQKPKKRNIIEKVDNYYGKFNKVWSLIILLALGLVIIQATPLANNNQENLEIISFPCAQTPDAELLTMDTSPLKTVYTITSVDNSTELFHLNVSKNSIPAITKPRFVKSQEVEGCISDEELVVVVMADSQVRLYPHRILVKHLAVNDIVNGTPILILYCGLCDSYTVYRSEYRGESLTFSNSGILYKNSDLLFDFNTETLWSQFNGKAITGTLTGAELEPYPFLVLTYGEAKKKYTDSEVLSFDTGFRRHYSDTGFKGFAESPDIVAPVGNRSDKLAPKELVVGFTVEGQQFAFSKRVLDDLGSLKITLEGSSYTAQKKSDGIELKRDGNTLNIQLYQAYWYVWFDFYPLTKLLTETP